MYKVECHARCSYSFVDGKCTDFNLVGNHVCTEYLLSDPLNVNEVDAIPYDIDGDQVVRLKLESVNHIALALRDGRKWKRYTSYTKSKSAMRRTYKRACKGGLECRNDGCEFYRKYNFRNYSQFDHCGDKVTCRECLYLRFPVWLPSM